MKAPVQVIVLRALAFLACTFLLTITFYGASNPFAPDATLPPALPPGGNGSAAPDNGTAPGLDGWQQLLGLLPEPAAEKLREAWAFGQSHQMGVVALGLLTCLLAMLLAGRIRCVRGRAGGAGPEDACSLGVEAERLCWVHGHVPSSVAVAGAGHGPSCLAAGSLRDGRKPSGSPEREPACPLPPRARSSWCASVPLGGDGDHTPLRLLGDRGPLVAPAKLQTP